MEKLNAINWINKLGVKLFVSFLLGLSLFLMLAGTVIYQKANSYFEQQQLELVKSTNRSIVENLRYQIAYASSLAHSLASTTTLATLEPISFRSNIKNLLASAPNQALIAGGGIWPEPFLFDENKNRCSFFWGKDTASQLQFFDNYNDVNGNGYHNEAWYVPIKYLGDVKRLWSGSYIDPYSLEPMVTVSVPIYKDQQFFGVSTVDMNLSGIEQHIHRVWENRFPGYSFLVDLDGKLISRIKNIPEHQFGDYPNISELSMVLPAFTDIADAVNAVTVESLDINSIDTDLATNIAEGSYQITQSQADLITAVIQQAEHNHDIVELHQKISKVDSAPIFEEPSFIIVTEIPETHWKIINVLPESHIMTEVNQGMKALFIPFIVITSFILLFFYWVMNRFFIRKISDISLQLTTTDLTDPSNKITTTDKGELGLITQLLNEQIQKLHDATKQLSHSKNVLQLKSQVSQSLQHRLEPQHLMDNLLASICQSSVLKLKPAAAILVLNKQHLIDDVYTQYGDIDLTQFDGYKPSQSSQVTISDNSYIIPITLETHQKAIVVLCAESPINEAEQADELASLTYIGYMINLALANEAARVELTEAKVNAEKANKAKSDFLAAMSHELRTPLNAILGFGHLLKKSTTSSLNKQQVQHLDFIIESSHHLLKLINQVLELSAIEAGKVNLDLQDTSLQQSIERVVDITSPMLVAQNLSLHIDTDEEIQLRADKTKLDQILINLISNAIKYNRPSGEIHLSWKKLNLDYVVIRIKDTGIGIPEEKFDAVFDPFDRLGKQASNIEGTGIGLSVTKDLIERMGGKIYFASKVDEGSTFSFELPVASGSLDIDFPAITTNNSDSKQVLPLPPHKDGIKVLYVEDINTNQALIKSFFEQWNETIQLEIAESAEIARTMLSENKYQLILMDLNLPGESGVDFTFSLKRNVNFADIPIIALTAKIMDEDVKAIKELFDAYITKPVNFMELTLVLEKHLLDQ